MHSTSAVADSLLAAAREYLRAAQSGRETADAQTALVRATTSLPLATMAIWESTLRMALALPCAEPLPARRFWSYWPYWRSDAERWPLLRGPRSFVWLDLASGDGYARERALHALEDGAPNAFFATLALRRLNDWVPEVRAAARRAVPGALDRADPDDTVAALWATLLYGRTWGRLDALDRQTLFTMVGWPRIASRFRFRLTTAPTGPVTSLLGELGRVPDFDGWWVALARDAVQPGVRARACRFLLQGRVNWVAGRKQVWIDRRYNESAWRPAFAERAIDLKVPVLDVLTRAATDPSAMVRRAAAEGLHARLGEIGPRAEDFARAFAADPSPGVAEWGRYALKSLGAATG